MDPAPQLAMKALADPIRWQIVELLACEELCVCHVVEALGVPQSLVSHHLKALRDANPVQTERHRYWTYYRLRPDAVRALAGSIAALADETPTAGVRRRPCS